MATNAAAIEGIASILNTCPVDDMALGNWIGALRSGDYKFGFGLMRSDEDLYDAFGVLAAISVVAWTWDEQEGAWSVDGEVYAPKTKMLADWLGVPWNKDTQKVVPHFLGLLIDFITEAGDSASSFEDVAYLIDEGRKAAVAKKARFNDSRDRVRSMGTISSERFSHHDSVADIRPYFARY